MTKRRCGKVDPRLIAFVGVALAGVLIGILFYFMTPPSERAASREENPTGQMR